MSIALTQRMMRWAQNYHRLAQQAPELIESIRDGFNYEYWRSPKRQGQLEQRVQELTTFTSKTPRNNKRNPAGDAKTYHAKNRIIVAAPETRHTSNETIQQGWMPPDATQKVTLYGVLPMEYAIGSVIHNLQDADQVRKSGNQVVEAKKILKEMQERVDMEHPSMSAKPLIELDYNGVQTRVRQFYEVSLELDKEISAGKPYGKVELHELLYTPGDEVGNAYLWNSIFDEVKQAYELIAPMIEEHKVEVQKKIV